MKVIWYPILKKFLENGQKQMENRTTNVDIGKIQFNILYVLQKLGIDGN